RRKTTRGTSTGAAAANSAPIQSSGRARTPAITSVGTSASVKDDTLIRTSVAARPFRPRSHRIGDRRRPEPRVDLLPRRRDGTGARARHGRRGNGIRDRTTQHVFADVAVETWAECLLVEKRSNEGGAEAVSGPNRVRNAYPDPRRPDGCDPRPRDSTARTAGQGDDPGPETEEQLEDVREWQIRIDPRRVVLAQLDDVGKTREPLEPAAVLVRVAEDLWADI